MKSDQIRSSFTKYVSMNILGMLGLSCYILADTYFISHILGADGLAALNFALPAYNLISGIGLMLGIGGAIRFSVQTAEQKHKQANQTFSLSLFLGILCGILIALAGILFSEPVSTALGANGEAFRLTNTYLKTILCFAPFFIANNILIAFVRNDGDPKLSMAAMLVGSFSNIILDYVFMQPFQMGMFGAAFATGLAPVISILVLSVHFLKRKNNLRLSKPKVKRKAVTAICSLGLSSFITEFAAGIILMIFNLVILNIQGNVGVAAYGVVANLALVTQSIFTGLSQGIQPLISSGYGKKDAAAMKQTLRYALVTSLVIACVAYAAVFLFSGGLVRIFNSENNAALDSIAQRGLKLYFTGFLFAGINIVLCTFFSAANHPKKAFTISLLRACVLLIPLLFLLSSLLQMDGVWLSFTVTEGITCAVSLWLLRRYPVNKEQRDAVNSR